MQKHNEEKLNKAFTTSDAVYLIFSVNGTGSFQGWARMLSRISYGQVPRTGQAILLILLIAAHDAKIILCNL